VSNAPLDLDSVSVGDELPTLVEHVDIVTNFMFGTSLWTAHRLHYDHVSAREDGFDAPLIPGALMSAYIARVVVDWAGDPLSLRRLSSRNLASEIIDSDLTVTGTVTAVKRIGRHGRVTCELTVRSGDRVLMESTAVVELRALQAPTVDERLPRDGTVV
jgi:acyl dehydratase